MILATTKERIIELIEYKDISKALFFKETGIKRGLLDADKLKSTVTDVVVAKIIATYPDVNPIWLITGEGEMLLTGEEKTISEVDDSKKCEELKKENDLLKQIIEAKNETIKALQNKDSNESSKR